MADLYVKAPNGEIVVIDSAEEQTALNAGYQAVDEATIKQAQAAQAQNLGAKGAAEAGLGGTPEGYNVPQAFAEKALSAATFGLAPGLDSPEAIAGGQKFAAERPGLALGAEVVGQLPMAVATGVGGAAAGASLAARLGGGLAARAAGVGVDVAAGAIVGGAQTEAEETRLSGEEFSWTDAAVTGLVGEVIGRNVGNGIGAAFSGTRNLIAKATRETVAQDAASSLTKGGLLNDFRVAHHAEQYQNELATLAADDLDRLETSFAEVSRQDRKRARIVRVVADNPEAQAAVRGEAQAGLADLYDSLSAELGDAPGPARSLLKQLDERMDALAEARGKKLWRLLDENRQALQDYAQDLHQAYENAPGSAWLSRDGLAKLDAAEKATRESLLREDVWGREAAEAQAAYNVPFHEKYFPTAKTVRGKLMQSTQTDARGFPVYRGDPGRVRSFLTRGVGDVDSARLAEQFSDYLDGVSGVARAASGDAPAAARETLEAVRRLRKAMANAEYIQAASARSAERGRFVELGVEGIGASAAMAAGGPLAGLAVGAGLRGARAGDFLLRAARKLGWGAGEVESMARLLEKDALPAAERADDVVSDLVDAGRSKPPGPPGPPSSVPPAGGGPAGGPRGGLTPSMRADAARGSWAPSTPPGAAGGTMADELAPGEAGVADDLLDAAGRPGREARAATPTAPAPRAKADPDGPEPGLGRAESLELEGLREGTAARQRDVRRMEVLTEGEFRDVVRQIRASGDETAEAFAKKLESSHAALVDDGLVVPAAEQAVHDAVNEARMADAVARISRGDAPGARASAPTEPPSLDEVDAFYASRPSVPAGSTAAKPIQDAGLKIRMGADRLDETVEHLFQGKAPTAEQWRGLAPLHLLARLGEVENARIDILGDSFIWSAEGVRSKTAPHMRDGMMDPGGLDEQTWSVSRTFSRDDAGRLEVHHDHFMVRGDLQATGVGAKVLKSMMEAYPKLGVDVVTVDSVEVGKYFWPSIGFDHPSPTTIRNAVRAYENYLINPPEGAVFEAFTPEAAAAAAKGLKSMPSLAQAEYGKEFLLDQPGPWNFGLRLDLTEANPRWHLMRGRLDIAAAAVAGLGSQFEGSAPAADEQQTAGAAAPGLAGFGAAAALFRAARGRVVRDVARRLFSAAAEPTLRTTARLAYSRAQLSARQEEFQAWQANPQLLVDRVAEGLRDAPPEAFASAAQGIYTAAAFLKEKLPQNAKPSPVALRAVPVGAEAASKYARYEQAALRPAEALREASESGYLSPELLETLQELYPDLLAEVRVEAYDAVQATQGAGLSIQAKTQYTRLFDGDGAIADPAFSQTATQMVQMAYEEAAAISPPKAGAGPRPGVSQVAAAVASPTPWVAA